MSLASLDHTVLRRFRDGPVWLRSMGVALPVARRLIETGYLERCRPVGGRAANMGRLTAKGEASLAVKA